MKKEALTVPDIYLEKKHLRMLQEIFRDYCPLAEIWAYGSRVGGDAHDGSDLDLAVIDFGEPNKSISELRAIIRDSNVPFLVDLVEFERLPASFQREIEKKFIKLFGKDAEVSI